MLPRHPEEGVEPPSWPLVVSVGRFGLNGSLKGGHRPSAVVPMTVGYDYEVILDPVRRAIAAGASFPETTVGGRQGAWLITVHAPESSAQRRNLGLVGPIAAADTVVYLATTTARSSEPGQGEVVGSALAMLVLECDPVGRSVVGTRLTLFPFDDADGTPRWGSAQEYDDGAAVFGSVVDELSQAWLLEAGDRTRVAAMGLLTGSGYEVSLNPNLEDELRSIAGSLRD